MTTADAAETAGRRGLPGGGGGLRASHPREGSAPHRAPMSPPPLRLSLVGGCGATAAIREGANRTSAPTNLSKAQVWLFIHLVHLNKWGPRTAPAARTSAEHRGGAMHARSTKGPRWGGTNYLSNALGAPYFADGLKSSWAQERMC